MSKDRLIDVRPASGAAYRIRVGKGALSTLGTTVRDLSDCAKIVLLSDEHVGPTYGKIAKKRLEEAGFKVYDLLVPPGEESKSLEIAEELWETLAAYGFNRNDLLVAVGGGVVGDLGGFVASTYMRGIDFIQVPTSLLAMVDASIGGKTAVDLKHGKNLVGTFHQPLHVCTDTRCLVSLGSEDWANGFAEIAKSSVVSPRRSFYEWLRSNAAQLVEHGELAVEEAVYTTADFKASVVSADERESGKRECLNYGHTLAHALETASGYGNLGHGRAVAEGMRFAARLAVEVLGADAAFVKRQDALLDSLGLQQLPFDFEPDVLLKVMKTDKKARGGQVRFVLARDFSDWEVVAVDDEVIMAHLSAWCAAKRRMGTTIN